MKRIYLTFLFTNYILFMPFIMVNCSVSDEPYNLLADDSDGEDLDPNAEILADCQTREYLTADCVTVLQGEDDRLAQEAALVAATAKDISQLPDCQDQMADDGQEDTEEATTSAETEADSTAAAPAEAEVACDEILADTMSSLEVCEEDNDRDYADDCDLITDSFQAQLFTCDQLAQETFAGGLSVCEDTTPATGLLNYCASLTASVYELCHDSERDMSLLPCFVADHIYSLILCECEKDEPSIEEGICSDVTGKQTVDEGEITTE